jgi:thymidylate synthase (FAD)
MLIVKAAVKEIQEENILKKIELCGRICYKSERLITEDSCKRFVQMLIKRQHMAMTEHAPIVLRVTRRMAEGLMKLGHGTYLNVTINDRNERYLVSGSVRAWYNLFTSPFYRKKAEEHIMRYEAYMQMSLGKELYSLLFPNVYRQCDKDRTCLVTQEELLNMQDLQECEAKAHLYLTALFVCDRGVSHELVRHRPASFAQESTRYCNYSREEFGKEITVIDPELEGSASIKWASAMLKAENVYFELLDWGLTPQEARGVLPTDLKTEIVTTCNLAEWQHIIDLRYHGTTGAPHPHMKKVMTLWYDYIMNKEGYNKWIK